MKVGYKIAIENATQKLIERDVQEVVSLTGAAYKDGEYHIPWMNSLVPLSGGSDMEKILWLHYLLTDISKQPTGEYISFRDIITARSYEPKFTARAVSPIIKRFGDCPEQLFKTALKLGGKKFDAGDYAVTVPALPLAPITYIIWNKDEEMPASASILFDKTAPQIFSAEDLVVFASLVTCKIINSAA